MKPVQFRNSSVLFLGTAIGALALAGCAKSGPTSSGYGPTKGTVGERPIISAVETKNEAARESIADGVTTTSTISVKITADKQALLSQEFLYGADLQYSSFYDSDMDLYSQSLALGHIPARFKIVGEELQLVADNQRLYSGELNHPEQLLSRFKIIAETETSLVLSGASSGVFLAEVFEGTHTDTHGGLSNPAGTPPRDSWIRSFNFDAKGNYILQETSVLLADGTIGEFMESVFPRGNIAPGPDFQKFQMDPDSAAGGDEGAVARYRLLPGEAIRDGETKLNWAQHFDISGGATIDWYVTRNIPDEAITPVKLAVEAWNRYFRKYKGIERDVVLFKGRLPEGVKIGDPRFNVINWDNRLVAGAAYESQATDPQTGKQSHSLIYMPAAWLKIGTDYWQNGRYSDATEESVSPAALGKHGGAVKAARIACLRSMKEGAALLASGRLNADQVGTFGVQLLKQTLFHEVGHALGLAHNFKGSLSYDPSSPNFIATTSIMDYNDFEIERQAFTSVDSAEGPALEYDRQALSAIYNKGADVAESDAVVPTCNDTEADAEDDGVDPLCIRYDIEKDPTHSVQTALDRIALETLPNDVTLSQAVKNVPAILLTGATVAAATDEASFKKLTARLTAGFGGSLRFYILTGKASLGRVVRTNVKSLLKFADDVLPEGFDAREMRERAFSGVQKALAFTSLSDSLKAALAAAQNDAVSRLAQTPYILGLARADADQKLNAVKTAFGKIADSLASDEVNGIPHLRETVYTALARHEAVPFFLGKLGDAQTDYEAAIVGILADAVVNAPESAVKHGMNERVAAAKALVTFRGRLQGGPAITRVLEALNLQRALATDNDSRETVETILAALKKSG